MIGLQDLSYIKRIEFEGQEEVSRAIRLSIAAELEAANLYTAIAEGCNNEEISRVMMDIAREEKVHAGEFMKLLKDINPQEGECWKEGEEHAAGKKYGNEITGDAEAEAEPIGEPYPKDMTTQPLDNFSDSALEGLNEEIDEVLENRK